MNHLWKTDSELGGYLMPPEIIQDMIQEALRPPPELVEKLLAAMEAEGWPRISYIERIKRHTKWFLEDAILYIARKLNLHNIYGPDDLEY